MSKIRSRMDILLKYFPNLSDSQIAQFEALGPLYTHWNEKINLISRKDIDELYLRHVLHSLAIARFIQFQSGAKILDVGTGGGFPGIPLAILFPDVDFMLIDAIGKKIRVVQDIARRIGLQNVVARHQRAENVHLQFDFVVSRAVTAMPRFVGWTRGLIAKESVHALKNGIIYLKGGDLKDELKAYQQVQITPIHTWFEEDFFETKKVVYLCP